MPVITQIADAVVATLNAATLSQPVTAMRAYLPRAEVADLKTLKVTVVPSSVMNASVTRSQSQQDVAIDVAIQKKPGNEQNSSFDPLLALAEEIGDLFRAERLESFPLAACIKTEFKTIYAPEHIENLRTFTSVLTLTFRVVG